MLQELELQVKELFEQTVDLSEYKDKIILSKELNLPNQTYFFRKQLLEKYGLKRMSPEDAILAMHNNLGTVGSRQATDEKHTYNNLIVNVGTRTHTLNNIKTVYKTGCVNYLYEEIPYGILLRMNELTKLDAIQAFFAVAPLDKWTQGETITQDPVIFASIINPKQPSWENYFLGRWV
jgi:hypothetical protein